MGERTPIGYGRFLSAGQRFQVKIVRVPWYRVPGLGWGKKAGGEGEGWVWMGLATAERKRGGEKAARGKGRVRQSVGGVYFHWSIHDTELTPRVFPNPNSDSFLLELKTHPLGLESLLFFYFLLQGLFLKGDWFLSTLTLFSQLTLF